MLREKKSKRLRKYDKQLKRSRVDFEKYVKDFYVDENNLAYISCNIKHYNDIIDPMSVEGYEWPSQHFTYFLESNAEYIPVENPIVLEICGGNLTAKQEATIEETIHDYYALKLGDAQLDIEQNQREALWLLIAGLAFAVILEIYTLTVQETNMFYEMIYLFFSLFVWDSAETFFLDGFECRENKQYAAQMAMIKVVFCDQFNDTPDNEAVTAELYSDILDNNIIEPEEEKEKENNSEKESS